MKKLGLVAVLLLFAAYSYSQSIRTLGNSDTTKTFKVGGYGEPFVGASMLNGDWAIMVGVKGGVTLNRFFSIGPVAKGYKGLWSFKGNNLNFNDSADLELSVGGIGLFLEYIYKMESPIHFSIPVNIMMGGVQVNEVNYLATGKNNTIEVENSSVLILEPAINVDFNLAKFFIPNLKVGYRAVIGSHLVNVSDSDLSGVYFGLGLKFGKF